MIRLSVAGRSEGLAASSAIGRFSIAGESITRRLADKLDSAADLCLPFEVLTIHVEALAHGQASNAMGPQILVKDVARLGRFHTGQANKTYELTLGESNFYSLGEPERRERIADAFARIAQLVRGRYAGEDAERLARMIGEAADEYRASP